MNADNTEENNQFIPASLANNNGLLLDQMPVGGTQFNISQYPDDYDKVQQTVYSMSQKLKSKAVKLKLQGLDELKNLLINDPFSSELEEVQMSKLLKENNPACLEKALLAMKEWINSKRSWDEQYIKILIENCFINGKNQGKKIAIEVCDLMYEAKSDQFERTITLGLKSKTPKIIGGYLGIINQLLGIYGPQKLKYLKPYINDVVRVLNTQKLPIVKNEGINLLKSAYKWMGKEMIDALIRQLKENMKKQLDNFWQSHNKSQVMEAPKGVPKAKENGSKVKSKVDAYEISQSVEILKHFDEKWTDSVLNAQKWSLKIELMQQLLKKVAVPKISNSQHRHIVQMIRRLLNDSNFNVVLTSLKLAGALSKGLRKNFFHSAKILFPLILGKMKEKKTQMIEEIFHTLNDFYFSLSIEDVSEDVKNGLKDKAPNMRSNIIVWIGKSIERKIEDKGQLPQKTKQCLKSMFSVFDKLLGDGSSEVRDCMSKTLARLKILIGDQIFGSLEKTLKKNTVNKGSEQEIGSRQNKISKSKDKRQNNDKSRKKKSSLDESFNNSKVNLLKNSQFPVDISEDIAKSLRKLNDSGSWQNRKESAQGLIRLIQRNNNQVIIKNFNEISAVLKSRINDPNKQLIRIFVQLIGLIFGCLSQKDIKFNFRPFVGGLVQGLSDKMESNRKQIITVLEKMGELVNQQSVLNVMGHYLHGENSIKYQVLSYVIKYEAYLQKVQVKQFPKGILSCLCDKNKDIRNMAEHIFPMILQRTGIEVFRNLVKDQKPVYQKDLSTFLDKFDKAQYHKKVQVQNYGSMKASPSVRKYNRKTSNNSLSKIKVPKDNEQSYLSQAYTAKNNQTNNQSIFIEGDENFAQLKILTQQRTERQEREERYCYISPCHNEEQLKEQVCRLFNQQLYTKMFSSDYKKNLDVENKIMKICKEISQQPNIRQVYDLLLGWVALKLYGGNPALCQFVQLVTPILSILQKKKIALADRYLQIIFTIIREYVISAHWTESANTQLLANIIKCTIALSSGFRVLKKIFQEFKIQINNEHRHCRRECASYYKGILVNLICENLSDSLSNDQILEEAAQVRELSENNNFITILKNKFHHSILEEFGFCQRKMNNYHSTSSFHQVNSSFKNEKEKEREREKSVNYLQTVESKLLEKDKSQPKLKNKMKTPSKPKLEQIQQYSSMQIQQSSASFSSQYKNQEHLNEQDYYIDLTCYILPNPYSVLSDNLNKLKNQNSKVSSNAITFFSTLFLENGKKIAQQLKEYSESIFATILNCLITNIKFRFDNGPQKIISYAILVQESIKCKHIFKNIGNNLLVKCIKFTADQLVYEDECREHIEAELRMRKVQYKPDSFTKAINGIMLRILQNCISQQSINILLRILTQSLPKINTKKLGLLVKCITRVANQYDVRKTDNHKYVAQFIGESQNYLQGIKLKNINTINTQLLNKSEDSIVSMIKNIFKMLSYELKIGIWKYYNQAKYRFEDDNGISQYIGQFVAQPQSTGYNSNSNSKVYQPISNYQSNYQYSPYQPLYKGNQSDEQLKTINELLSKTKTFKQGIKNLRQYMGKNKAFNVTKYFKQMNYENGFIQLVQNQLQKQIYEPERQLQSRDNLSANINQKLKQLKLRFDGMNNTNVSVNKTHQNLTPKNKRDASRSMKNNNNRSTILQQKQEGNPTDMKKRIQEMKKRVNFASTNRIR